MQKFIPDLTDCNESNENMFYAAQSLYKAMKKRKELKLINQAINDYEDYLNQQIEEEFSLEEFSLSDDDEDDE